MWAALETIGALSVLTTLLGVAIGVTLWYTNRRGRVLAYCLVAFLLSGVVLMVAARMDDTSDEPGTTTRGVQTRPQSTVLTPPGPAPTVQATPTTAPPAVSESCPAPLEDAYFSDMVYILVDLGDDLAALDRLAEWASRDPSLLTDDYWESDMADVLDFLESDADELESLEPPDSVAEIHSDNLELARTIREFVLLFVRGMTDLDAETLRESAVKMASLGDMAKANARVVSTFCP